MAFSTFTAPGATRVTSVLSGSPGDTLLISGGARIFGVQLHQAMTSGQPLFFYDGAPSSGGPGAAANSGKPIVGCVPTPTLVSGQVSPAAYGVFPLIGYAYSGVSAFSTSGQPGYSLFWTPEKPQAGY